MDAEIRKPQELTAQNFESFVVADGIAVIDWWASWCGPCRMFAPIFEKAAATHTDMRFGKINTDEQRELSASFDITSIPTLMIFRDRVLLYSEAGALPGPVFEELLSKVKELDMDEVRRKIAAQKPDEEKTDPSKIS